MKREKRVTTVPTAQAVQKVQGIGWSWERSGAFGWGTDLVAINRWIYWAFVFLLFVSFLGNTARIINHYDGTSHAATTTVTTTPPPVPACVVAQAKTATAWKTVAAGEAKVNALLATHHLHSAVVVQHQVNRYRRHHLTSGDCP